MSVLVEAISILIPKHALDEKFPGGADGYLRLARRAPGARWAIADERITCVSFESLDDGQRFVEPLRQAGFDGSPDPVAFVDQYFGPTAVFRWLRWRRHDEGFTSCWLEGAEAGELAAPPNWSAGARENGAVATRDPEFGPPTEQGAPAVDFSFDAGLLPEEFEEITVEPLASEEHDPQLDVAIDYASDDDVNDEPFAEDAHAEEPFAEDAHAEEPFAALGPGDLPHVATPETTAPSPDFALALDEVPPPLPADGWDPTDLVRDDASELAHDLPPATGDSLFESLHLGAVLENALSASPRPDETPAHDGAQEPTEEPAVMEERDGPRDVEPREVVATDAVEEPILTFRPPVGDGWDEEEEHAADAHADDPHTGGAHDPVVQAADVRPVRETPAVAETPAWGSAPHLATEEEDWWDGDAESDEPVEGEKDDATEDASVNASEQEDESQLVYGAWLPDLPSSAGGAQPTPSSGTALLEAEEQETEDFRGYHESYASVAEGIVPAFAVPDSVVARTEAASHAAPAQSELATNALGLARNVLQRKGWLLREEDEGTLLFQVRGSRARFQGAISLERGVDTLRIQTHLPTSVPPASHGAVAEFLLRAAPRLALGAFELDYETGEMRCRLSVDLGDAPLTDSRLERLLGEGVKACDQYHDAVMQLVYAGRSVADALAELDSSR